MECAFQPPSATPAPALECGEYHVATVDGRCVPDPDAYRPHLVGVRLGLALAVPDQREADGPSGTGVWLSGEYAYAASSWVQPRGMFGMVATTPDDPSQPGTECVPRRGDECEVSTLMAFTGVTIRIAAPIPYVAPFLELGAAVLAGTATTRTELVAEEAGGVFAALPVNIGFALGRHHHADIAFRYLFNRSRQTMGGITLGYAVPLGDAVFLDLF